MKDVGYGIERSTIMGGGCSANAWFPSVGGLFTIESLEVEFVIRLGRDLREEAGAWLSSR